MKYIRVVNSNKQFSIHLKATDSELEAALEAALEAGYRHIDTAPVYENEHVIGKVLHKWLSTGRVKREDLFIVTKVGVVNFLYGMKHCQLPFNPQLNP